MSNTGFITNMMVGTYEPPEWRVPQKGWQGPRREQFCIASWTTMLCICKELGSNWISYYLLWIIDESGGFCSFGLSWAIHDLYIKFDVHVKTHFLLFAHDEVHGILWHTNTTETLGFVHQSCIFLKDKSGHETLIACDPVSFISISRAICTTTIHSGESWYVTKLRSRMWKYDCNHKHYLVR